MMNKSVDADMKIYLDAHPNASLNDYINHINALEKAAEDAYTEQEELVNDMMMLLASFSGKVYSLRAQENRKKKKNQKENEKI